MIKVKPLGSNMTELTFVNRIKEHVNLLFSYETPVAGWDSSGAFRTDEYHSLTSRRHINKYLGDKDVGRKVSPDYIESLLSPGL